MKVADRFIWRSVRWQTIENNFAIFALLKCIRRTCDVAATELFLPPPLSLSFSHRMAMLFFIQEYANSQGIIIAVVRSGYRYIAYVISKGQPAESTTFRYYRQRCAITNYELTFQIWLIHLALNVKGRSRYWNARQMFIFTGVENGWKPARIKWDTLYRALHLQRQLLWR